MKKAVKKAVWTLAGAAAAASAAYLAVGNVFYNITLTPKAMKMFAEKSADMPENAAAAELYSSQSILGSGVQWYNSTKKENVITLSDDGDRLRAELITNDNGESFYAVCCHGFSGDAASMGAYAKLLYEMGMSVILPHMRGHEGSEIGYVSMGWHDRLDVVSWVKYILQRDANAKIVLFGVSMGAATVMMATGERLPENVVCAVSDCGYSSVWEEFSSQIRKFYRLPPFPFINAADTVTRLRAKYSFKEASSLNQVKKSVTPTLFIHGEADDFVPFWMLDKLYDAASCEKEKLTVPGAEHACSIAVEPELYMNAVKQFISKYLR